MKFLIVITSYSIHYTKLYEFVAFVFLGNPTRKMGYRLNAHTFPELLGKRYDSKFIQIFGALIILLFMPLYATAVLIGGTHFIVITSYSIHYTKLYE